jgi:hypothetical protein
MRPAFYRHSSVGGSRPLWRYTPWRVPPAASALLSGKAGPPKACKVPTNSVGDIGQQVSRAVKRFLGIEF